MTSSEGLAALSNTAALWIPVLTSLAARLGATRTGRHIDANLKARFRWLSDPEATKAFFEAFTAGTTRYEREHADSPSASAVTQVLAHIAEHGAGGLDQATILEQVFRNRSNLATLQDVVHRYAWILESDIVPLGQISESLRELIDDYLRPAFLESQYFTTRVGFIEVIGLLQDIRDQLAEPTIDLAGLERDYRSQLMEKYEYITMQGISPRVQNRTIGIKLQDIFIAVRAVNDAHFTTLWSTYDTLRSFSEAATAITAVEKQQADEVYANAFSALNVALTEPSMSQESLHEARRRFMNYVAHGQLTLDDIPREHLYISSHGTGKSTTVQELAQELLELQRLSGRLSASLSEFLGARRVVIQGHPGSGKSTLTRYVTWAAASRRAEVIGSTTAERIPVHIRAIDFGETLEAGSVTTLEEYLTEEAGRFSAVINYALLTGRAVILVDGLDEVGKVDLRARVAESVDDFLADPLFRDNAVVVTTRMIGYEPTGLLGRLPHFTLSELTDEQISKFVQAWYRAIDAELPEAVDVAAERDRLLEAINRKPSLKRMARNPLLLTIIALIKWQGRALPDLRVLLYDVAAQTLIRSWPLTRRRVELDELLIREWLAPVALKIFADPTSDLIDEFSLMEELVASMQRLKPMTELEARRASRELLESVSLHTGVLLPRGTDHDGRTLYGFLHQTFTEYFAAYLLAGKWEDGDLDLARYAQDPYWLEVVLLMAGHLGTQRREKAGRFLKDLRELSSSPYEPHIHRDLLLTVKVLADGVPVGPGEFVEELLHNFLRVWRKTPFRSLRDSIEELLGGLAATEYGTAVLRLVRRMALSDDELLAVAKQLGPENFVEDLRNILTKEAPHGSRSKLSEPYRKLRAARLLVEAGDAGARDILSDLAHARSSFALNAIKGLIELGDPRAVEAVLWLLAEPELERQSANLTLESLELGPVMEDPRISSALQKLLTSKKAPVRRRAATILLQRRRLSTDELAAVLREEPLVVGIPRGMLRVVDPEVGKQLRQLLHHREPVIRLQAAKGLMRQDNPDVEALLPLLEDEASRVRLEVAAWFVERGEPRAVEALASLLDEGTDLRLEAARILHRNGDVRGTESLRGLLKDRDSEVRIEAADELAEQDDPAVAAILVAALEHPFPPVRVRVASTLASWGDRRAIKQLVELLADRITSQHAQHAERVLTRLDIPDVTDILLDSLTTDGKASGIVMRILARRGDPRANEVLRELLVDESIDVRTDAARALLTRVDEEVRSIVENSLDRILEDIQNQKGPRRDVLANATYDFIQKYLISY